MLERIEKHQVEDLKKWMIDFLKRNNELFYVHMAGYEDYEFVDKMFFKIIKDFDDHIRGVENSITFETLANTSDDKMVVTDYRISIYSEIKKSIGIEGSIVYIQFENEALWNSVMYLKPNLEEAIKFANIMIEAEIGGLNNRIKDIEDLKEKITNRF